MSAANEWRRGQRQISIFIDVRSLNEREDVETYPKQFSSHASSFLGKKKNLNVLQFGGTQMSF